MLQNLKMVETIVEIFQLNNAERRIIILFEFCNF
jgi:hypothetical protein